MNRRRLLQAIVATASLAWVPLRSIIDDPRPRYSIPMFIELEPFTKQSGDLVTVTVTGSTPDTATATVEILYA